MCLNTICRNMGIPGRLGRRSRPRVPAGGRCGIGPAVFAAGLLITSGPVHAVDAPVPQAPEAVVVNDNTRPAGVVEGNTVTVRLRAARGSWRPEGPGGPELTVDALGEAGSPLAIPAPLIRVVEGATLAVSLRNDLDSPLRVHGLCARDGGRCAPVDVAPSEEREVRFVSGRPGTYHYWATSIGAPVPLREMAGALVVDPDAGTAEPDRIFVITEWTSLTSAQLRDLLAAEDVNERFVALAPRFTFVINGLSWPATERLRYRRGERVRWRVINLSSQTHPMHLHGFYFTVLRTGDGWRDVPAGEGAGLRVVTHTLPSGGTLLLEWIPERAGNWLFHCHVMHHVSPARRLAADAAGPHASHHHAAPGAAALGMAGMVLGITVLPSNGEPDDTVAPADPRRRLTMTVAAGHPPQSEAIFVAFAEPGTDVSLDEAAPRSPGPVLVLQRGEPVEITIVNHLAEPTSIHWHGLELESYYDGVHGWSGMAGQTAPMIEPGGSFVVRLTPPRAGTFIYHTHLHDYRQLSSGLYGGLLVTEPGERYDPSTDHVVVLGRRNASEESSILQEASSLVLNGERAPRWSWRSGKRHRIRVINITPDDVLSVALLRGDAPVTWRPVAKDGAPVPAGDGPDVPAKVRIAVGETYDFECDAPSGRGTLWLDVRTTSGKWQAQGHVVVR